MTICVTVAFRREDFCPSPAGCHRPWRTFGVCSAAIATECAATRFAILSTGDERAITTRTRAFRSSVLSTAAVSYYDRVVEVHRSARKHGLGETDIRQAAEHYLIAYPLDEDWPPRELRLGFDTAGRLLETVVLHLDDDELVIHAMKARPQYFNLLP